MRRGVIKRDGAAVRAIGREIIRLKKQRKRTVQRMPRWDKRAWVTGDRMRPPMPAPERTKPMAVPRWAEKYSGVMLTMGK